LHDQSKTTALSERYCSTTKTPPEHHQVTAAKIEIGVFDGLHELSLTKRIRHLLMLAQEDH